MGLARLFGPYGNIHTITIVRDRATKVCKGYGFIEMQNPEEANEAIAALNGRQMGDRQLTIKQATEKPTAPLSTDVAHKYKKVERPGAPIKKKRPRRPM